MAGWTTADMPDQSGQVAVVTGANSGLGFAIAEELAARGAHVVLGCRNPDRGRDAVDRLRAHLPDASVELAALDLADLDSVRTFADTLDHDRIDLLVANAGVMAIPFRQTAQGFELQFGTNHLGHFALTGRLLGRLLAAEAPRVVVQSSGAHRMGNVDMANLQSERGYRRWRAYGASKLANLLFAYELDRRARARDVALIAVAAHPGYASTELQTAGARMEQNALKERLAHGLNRMFGQSAAMGAEPALYAATMPFVRGGEFFGPGELGGMRGHPVRTRSSAASRDLVTAGALWDVSERLTDVRYEWPVPTSG